MVDAGAGRLVGVRRGLIMKDTSYIGAGHTP